MYPILVRIHERGGGWCVELGGRAKGNSSTVPSSVVLSELKTIISLSTHPSEFEEDGNGKLE